MISTVIIWPREVPGTSQAAWIKSNRFRKCSQKSDLESILTSGPPRVKDGCLAAETAIVCSARGSFDSSIAGKRCLQDSQISKNYQRLQFSSNVVTR